MFDDVLQALMHTPWWVYIIFLYCLFVGYKGMRGGVVPFGKMLVMPILFTYLSFHTVYTHFHFNSFVYIPYGLGMLAGIVLGVIFAQMLGLEVDREHGLLKFPGSWQTMLFILIIFAVKYYFGYASASDPGLLHSTRCEFLMLSTSALVTGMFVGRAIYYYIKLRKGPSTDLS